MSALNSDDFEKLFNDNLKNGLSSFNANRYALRDTMKDSSDSNIVKTFSAMAEGARTAAASVNASSGSIVKDLAFIGGGIKGLWTSLSAFGKIGLIAGIGYGIYKIADALIVTGEEAKQAMTDSFETYKSSTASVDELNSKLSETQAKINELSTKGGLTIVEQSELDKLNEQNKLLQMELDLKEEIARNDAISAGESAVTSFKKNYGTGITTKDVQDKVTEYEERHGAGSFSRLNEDTILEAETYFQGEDLKTNLFKYKAYQQAYQNMLNDPGAQLEDIQAASDNVDAMKSLIDEEALGLIDILKNINDLTVDVKNREDIKGTYEAAKNSLNAIYEITDPAKWEQTKLDDFLSRNSISKQKQQLLDKAKADKYKGISISDLSESLKQAAANAGIQDMQTIVDAINSEAGVFNVEEAKKQIKKGFLNSSYIKDYSGSEKDNELSDFAKFINGLNDEDIELAYKLSLDIDSSEWSPEVWEQRLTDLKSGADVAVSEFKDDVSTAIEQQSKLTAAFAAGNSATGMTYDQIQEVCNAFKKLEGFDMASLFERTATGVQMNADAFKKYNETLQADTQLELLTALEAKQKKYNEAIQNFKDTGEDKYSSLADSYAKDIEQLALLINELEAASSKYNAFVTASSGANRRDSYTNVSAGYKSVKELLNQGWVSDDSVTSYLDLVLGDGWQEKTENDAKKAFRLISSPYETEAGRFTGHSLKSYLEADGSGNVTSRGAWTFAEDLVKLQRGGIFGDQNIATKDADGLITLDLTGDKLQTVADKLGTTTDMVDLLGKALSDAGMSVTFDDAAAAAQPRSSPCKYFASQVDAAGSALAVSSSSTAASA